MSHSIHSRNMSHHSCNHKKRQRRNKDVLFRNYDSARFNVFLKAILRDSYFYLSWTRVCVRRKLDYWLHLDDTWKTCSAKESERRSFRVPFVSTLHIKLMWSYVHTPRCNTRNCRLKGTLCAVERRWWKKRGRRSKAQQRKRISPFPLCVPRSLYLYVSIHVYIYMWISCSYISIQLASIGKKYIFSGKIFQPKCNWRYFIFSFQ